MRLKGKRVVIVGGSSGIGLAVAAASIREGAEVFIGSSQQSKVDEAKEQLGRAASGAIVDVLKEASVAEFFEQAKILDHLVYTAGDWGHRDPKKITETEVEDFGRALGVRFYGALLAVKYAVPRIEKSGSITLTSGLVAHRPRKGVPLSTAMAGAVEHLTCALAVDLAPVRVNAVCPGIVATAVWGENAADQFKDFIDALPLQRMGEPEDIAESYVYLMRCGYVTGDILVVDGGRSLI